MDILDFQLGKVEKLNEDGTIDIRDFRTGGIVYRNVSIEHTAAAQQQPVVGQHVLFFTLSSPVSSSIVKVVKFYGSKDADQQLVLSSPIDLGEGEYRIVSQKGDMVYVANGALYLAGCGQSIMILDEKQLTQILGDNIKIISRDGTLIEEKDGKLTLQKGTLRKKDITYEIQNPSVTITIEGKNVTISGKDVSVNINCKDAKICGDKPVAREGDEIEIELSLVPTANTPIPQGGTLAAAMGVAWAPGATVTLKGRIVKGSSKVKVG